MSERANVRLSKRDVTKVEHAIAIRVTHLTHPHTRCAGKRGTTLLSRLPPRTLIRIMMTMIVMIVMIVVVGMCILHAIIKVLINEWCIGGHPTMHLVSPNTPSCRDGDLH